jgi:hypothetical protein
MECINATSLRRKSGQMGHPAFVAGATKLIIPLEPNIRRIQMKKQSWGFAPSFSAHVRSHGKPGQVGEQGAPVQFP